MKTSVCMISTIVSLFLLGCGSHARSLSDGEVINQSDGVNQRELLYYHVSTGIDPMGPIYIFDVHNGERLHSIFPWHGSGTHTDLKSDEETVTLGIFPSGASAVISEFEGELVVRLSRNGVMYGPELQSIGSEDDGAVTAFSDSMSGLLDIERGEWILAPTDYLSVGTPNEGRVVAWDLDGRWAIYDYAGKRVGDYIDIAVNPRLQQPIFMSGVMAVSSGNTITLLDRDGNAVAECVGRDAGYFHEGYARCQSGERGKRHLYGYIDVEGEWSIEPLYRSAGYFSEGLAPVSYESWLNVSHDGSFSSNVFPLATESTDAHLDIDDLEERDDRWGYINRDGDLVIPMVFDEVRHFSEGLAAAKSGELWGYIGLDGQWVLEPKFLQANHFQEGFAVVRFNGDTDSSLIDQEGTVVIAP